MRYYTITTPISNWNLGVTTNTEILLHCNSPLVR